MRSLRRLHFETVCGIAYCVAVGGLLVAAALWLRPQDPGTPVLPPHALAAVLGAFVLAPLLAALTSVLLASLRRAVALLAVVPKMPQPVRQESRRRR